MLVVNPQTDNPILLADIFHSILDFFLPEAHPEDRRSLVSLARTCRALSGPSLNRLWKTLSSFDPVVQCYAGDNIKNVAPPSPSQLAIIERYGHRVKELAVTGETALHFLHSTTLHTHLFPNLKVLRWNAFRPSLYIPITFIQPFLIPQLLSLQVSFAEEEDDPTVPSFFDDYLVCSNLKSLKLEFPNWELTSGALPPTAAQALSNAICRQRNLENVDVNAVINHSALGHLATLPTLKVLSVYLPEQSQNRPGPNLHTELVFCGVEELSLTTSNLELLTSLLRPDIQIFHTFRLDYSSLLTSAVMLAFLEVLALRSPTKPFRTVHLKCGDFSHPMPIDLVASEARHYRLLYKTLQPLKVFGSLRQLVIIWSEQISLDDIELADLASSWPFLRDFYCTCYRGPFGLYGFKYPTLRSLPMLIPSWPELESLTLPLDAMGIPEIEGTEPFEGLDHLGLFEAPIDAPLLVAQYLHHYFPSLLSLEVNFNRAPGTDHDLITAYEVAWQQVEDYISELSGCPLSRDSSEESDSDDDELGDSSD